MKHTKESLQAVANRARSFLDMTRVLGLKPHGGTASHLKKRCEKFGVCTDHFVGMAWAGGTRPSNRKSASEILVIERTKTARRPRYQLCRALREIGRKEVCGYCGQSAVWNGKPLVLQIDHRNGDVFDNRASNLAFACPNCHSQTPTFGNLGGRTGQAVRR